MEVLCNSLNGEVDINQISATSRIHIPENSVFTAVTKGKKGTDHCIYGSTAGCWKDNIM